MTVLYICLAVFSVPIFCGLILQLKDRDAAAEQEQ